MFVTTTARLTHAGAKHMMVTALAQAQAAGIAMSVAIGDAGGHLVSNGDWQTDARIAVAAVESIGAAT
jgi:uncharacterized protein GlcG (DUF336 family)